MGDQDKPPLLADKIKGWLNSQGYPLEFRTAAAVKSAGMRVFQGYYVTEQDSSQTREIDVLGKIDTSSNPYLEVGLVVECKWSRDKPWVVFTSRDTGMAPSACIAQTIASRLGQAAMHCLAADPELAKLEIFQRNDRNGFGGRQVFEQEKGTDHFYAAIQSVVGKALAYARGFDHETGKPNEIPESGCLAFPLIVVEGELFESFYDADRGEVVVTPADVVRLHWRGADAHRWIATVDIVRSNALARAMSARSKEFLKLGTAAKAVVENLARCYKERRLDILDMRVAPRGYVGVPPLLRELYEMVAGK